MSLRWKLRSRGNVDAKLTESGDTRSEQLLMMPTGLSGTLKAWLVFRHEISDMAVVSSWQAKVVPGG